MKLGIMACALWWAAALSISSPAQAQGLAAIDTQDGLHARFRLINGSVLSMMTWDKPVDLRLAPQDYPSVSFKEYGPEDRSGVFRFQDNSVGDGAITLRSTSEEMSARLKARICAEPGAIRYDVDFEDLSGDDRALTLRFQFPIDATGWMWWDDIATSRVIEPDTRYVHHGRERTGNYPLAWSPLGSISNPRNLHTLTLALPINPPRIARVGYDGNFFIEWDLGVSALTEKFPSKSSFSFVLYHSDAEWGMRGALKKYYDLFPQHFLKRTNREGTWLPRTPTTELVSPADFGITFHEHSSVKVNTLPYNNAAGHYCPGD